MQDAVVVHLDGELRPLHAERSEQLGLALERCYLRHRLCHPPEDDATGLVARQLDRHHADARLEADDTELQRRGEHERRAEGGVAGERELDPRRENAHPRVRSACAGRTKTVSEKPISSASACIVTGSRSRASVNTASWLPASGTSVKTSATT